MVSEFFEISPLLLDSDGLDWIGIHEHGTFRYVPIHICIKAKPRHAQLVLVESIKPFE
jgi:hypothetical protein